MADFLELATVAIFALTYFFVIRHYSKKSWIVWSSALALFLLGAVKPLESAKAINWNVLGIYFGMLFVSEIFIFSRVPDAIATYLINRVKHVSTVLILIAVLAGLISIAVENVAVVLITAPIALSVTRKLGISPVPVLIGIAVSSNLQGVATLIGDPPSMLLAAFAKLSFNDFFFYNGRPSLFFAVQIGALASIAVLYFLFRHFKSGHPKFREIKVRSFFPGALILALIAALALSSIFDPDFSFLAGMVTIIFGLVAIMWYYFANRNDFMPMLRRADYETGFFLAGIFILVESLIKVGFVDDVAVFVSSLTGQDMLLAFVVIIVMSLIFSAFIDNVPFVAAMLPVVYKVSQILNVNPALFYFGLLIGASVGGNITPIGASTNIVAIGIAKKHGYRTRFMDFVRIGLPFTLVSVAASTAFVYFVFG